MRTILWTLAGFSLLAGLTLEATVDRDTPEPEFDPTLVGSGVAIGDSISGFQDVIRMPSSIGEVEFPHLEHSDDFGIECTECHHEVNAAALHIPHQDYFKDFWIDCKTCHGNGAEPKSEPIACSKCHHDRPSSISDETLSSKVVIHKKCWDCHEVGTGAEASAACASCHSGPKNPYRPLEPSQ